MYSMHKKSIAHLLFSASEGFLLTEFIISFAVLSLAVMMCAHAFFSAVHEYTHARQRLHLYTLVQNNIEFSWSGTRGDGGFANDRIKKQSSAVERGIVLPDMPKLMQEWLEINVAGKGDRSPPIRLRGLIRDE